MDDALEEAAKALKRGEVPVGAVIVEASGDIIARAGNETRERLDPSAHAEVLAIRKACDTLKTERLVNCDIYVTLEPCAMCAGLIANARIRRIYFAYLTSYTLKTGAVARANARWSFLRLAR